MIVYEIDEMDESGKSQAKRTQGIKSITRVH